MAWNDHPRKRMFVEKFAWLHHELPKNSFQAPGGKADSNLCLLCAGGDELESHILSRLPVTRIWRVISLRDCRVVSRFGTYSFRTCLSQIFFDQGVNEWVECNIASGVRVDDHIQWTSLFGVKLLCGMRGIKWWLMAKGLMFKNFKSKFVQ